MYIHLHDMSIFHFSEGMVGKKEMDDASGRSIRCHFSKTCLPAVPCDFGYSLLYFQKYCQSSLFPLCSIQCFFSVGNLSCGLEVHIWILERPGKGFLLPSFVLVECYRFDFFFFHSYFHPLFHSILSLQGLSFS